MLAILGNVVFDIAPMNYHDLSASMDTSHATHEVVGAPKIYEHTGEGERSIQIKGAIFPEFSGGVAELGALEAMRAKGDPQHLMLGSGFPAGWVIIDKIQQDHSFIAPGGTGREVKFTLSLKRCDIPMGDLGDLLGQFIDGLFDVAGDYLG